MTQEGERPRIAAGLNKTVLVLLLSAALITMNATGCRMAPPCVEPASSVAHYLSPGYNPARIRRVLVLPPENTCAYPDAAMDFYRILVAGLNSAGVFEPVVADRDSLLPWMDAYISTEGQFPEQMLVELRQRFRVDGVLFLSLTDVHPYWPQRWGVMMHLVDTYDASISMTLSGHWNAGDGTVANQARADFRRSTIASSIGDVELALHSPHYFSEFVARQLSDRIVELAQASISPPNTAARLAPITH